MWIYECVCETRNIDDPGLHGYTKVIYSARGSCHYPGQARWPVVLMKLSLGPGQGHCLLAAFPKPKVTQLIISEHGSPLRTLGPGH